MAVPTLNVDNTHVFVNDDVTYTIGAATNSTSGAPIYVLLYTLGQIHSSTQITEPGGFSHVVTYTDGGANTPAIFLYVKTSTGSESGSYTFTIDTSDFGYIQCIWVSDSDESDPLPAAHRAGTDSGGVGVSNQDAPSVTTGRDDCRVLRVGFWRTGGSNPDFGLTDLEAVGSRAITEYQTQTTAGATGTENCTSSTTSDAVTATFAFQPVEITGTQALRRFTLNIT